MINAIRHISVENLLSMTRSEYSDLPSTIALGMTLRGDAFVDTDLAIGGTVEGSIQCSGTLVILSGGIAIAEIKAETLVIHGSVVGSVEVTNKVDLRSGGSLIGEVISSRIRIEEGAFFKGGIDIRQLPEGSQSQTAAPPKRMLALEGSALADRYDAEAEEKIAQGLYQTLPDDESTWDASFPRPHTRHQASTHSRRRRILSRHFSVLRLAGIRRIPTSQLH
jgi:cytoskeletal protein CcmA (bactofilin family)